MAHTLPSSPPRGPRFALAMSGMLLLCALVLAFCLPNGLPSRQRIALLTHGFQLSPQEIQQLTSLRQEQMESMEEYQSESSKDLLAKYLEHKLQKHNEIGLWPGREHSRELKLTAFRSYLLGGQAMDERNTFRALSRIKPAQLDFDPKMYLYGGAYIYPMGGLIYLAGKLGWIHLSGRIGDYLDQPEHLARMFLLGRGVNALALLSLLLICGLWARRLGGDAAGLAALAALALSPVLFWHALIAKPHLYCGFFSLAAMAHLAACRERPGLGAILLNSFLWGMAWGSALSSLVTVLALPIILFEPRRPLAWLRPTFLIGLGGGLVFLLSNPYALLNYEPYWHTFLGHPWQGGDPWPKLANYYHSLAWSSFAAPWGGLGLLGALWEVVAGRGLARRLGLLALLLTLLTALSAGAPRAGLFAAGPLMICAGLLVARLLNMLPARRRWPRWALVVLIFGPALLWQSAQVQAALDDRPWLEPARKFAGELAAHPQAVLGIYGTFDPTNLPPLPFLPHRVINMDKWEPGQAIPDYVIVGHLKRQEFLQHSPPALREALRLKWNLGYRNYWDWPWLYPMRPLSRSAAWVYVPNQKLPQTREP